MLCLGKALRICLLGFSLRSQSIASGAMHLPALSVRLPAFTALHPSENPLSFTLLKQVLIPASANRHKCSSQKRHPSGCLFFGRVLFRWISRASPRNDDSRRRRNGRQMLKAFPRQRKEAYSFIMSVQNRCSLLH